MENFSQNNPETLSTEDKVRSASSFEELYKVLNDISEIKGESGTYEPTFLKERIEQVRQGHEDINYITRALGLREKVKSLLSGN